MAFKSICRTYYTLTKPGIVYGNDLSALAGFFLATAGSRHFNVITLITMVTGISLIMASACVYNNYIDRNIDRNMARTKNRALVIGTVSPYAALTFATVLGIVGSSVLCIFTNWLTTVIAVGGLFAYVVVYGIGKRHTSYSTALGSISGGIPPVVGYCAVTGKLDVGAGLLFLILVVWQMPHFYSIAMYRQKEYAAAQLPVLPVVHGILITQKHIRIYIALFIIISLLPSLYGYTGLAYALIMVATGSTWLALSMRTTDSQDLMIWARKVFRFSLIVLLIFCTTISLTAILP